MGNNTSASEDQPGFSRRKLLAAFGVAGLSAASASAMPGFAQQGAAQGVADFRFYSSVAEMRQDEGLKEGTIIKTYGYDKAGDGGGAEYLVVRQEQDAPAASVPGHILLHKRLEAVLINALTVNYKMFGAKGQQGHDDGPALKATHEYANRLNLPVVNLNGEYWITETNNIPIATDVTWGKTIFHIDEKYNSTTPRFKIISQQGPLQIELSASGKAAVLSGLKPGASIINELSPYKNMLLHITDLEDRVGFRSGKEYGGKASRPREELFYVEEYGRIIGGIAWPFRNYTSLIGYPAEESYLTVEGGTFYLSGAQPLPFKNGYLNNGFLVNRSRTIIRNQWVGLEKGQSDTSLNARNGFYNFSKVYDVLLENVRLLPWEKDRPDKEKSVSQGTYGISGSHMLNVVFRNITAEGSAQHWGVFGTNLNKNFRIEYCKLNRVDVHFHCWNLYVSHSEIGFKGLTVTGGGDLFIENTRIQANTFIAFRKDYGGKWSGSVHIRNCRLLPVSPRPAAILSFSSDDFAYGYPIGYAHKIKVEDFVVDYANIPASTAPAWLIIGSAARSTAASGRLFFPYLTEFKNILVEGRDKGMRLLELPDVKMFELARAGKYDGTEMICNARLVFDGVQLEDMGDMEVISGAHISLGASSQGLDKHMLIPSIQFKECAQLIVSFAAGTAELQFENCSIAQLNTAQGKAFPGSIRFVNCKFKPLIHDSQAPYGLSSTLGTSFTNCVVHLPQAGQQSRPDLLPLLDFMAINKTLKYNHLNTRLGTDILSYCKSKGIVLKPQFISMLQSRHELEPQNL